MNVEDKPFLDGYGGQTTDELIALAEHHRVDSIVLAFESALDHKLTRLGADALSNEELDVLAIEALEREVNNGGYSQFFFNSSCFFARVVPQSLSKIGCNKTLEVTREALRAVGTDDPERLPEIMSDADDDLCDRLDACDSRYYESGEDIAALLFDFIKKNRHAITL